MSGSSPDIGASPDLYPVVLDVAGDRALTVRLDEASYGSASFLDERILADTGPGAWTAMSVIERASATLPERADYIFHIGHVGSTLLSRLLGLSRQVFSLREPAILRTLAQMAFDLDAADAPWSSDQFERRLGSFLRLWSRVYRPSQKSLIKTTSFVSEMAPMLLDRSPGARAILMSVSPRVYIASILAGPASRAGLASLASQRLLRLHRRLGGTVCDVARLSEGEVAAMSWTCEVLGLARAAERFSERVLWLDFERFLDAPRAGLETALAHLHGAAVENEVATMLESPQWGRYSKGPDHAYDADLRRRILAQAAVEHSQEIERGVAWLRGAMTAHPAVDTAVRWRAAASGP